MSIDRILSYDVELKDYTTFRTGGKADYFAECHSEDDIQDALVFAKEKHLPVFVLGGGSNVLISDSGFRGLVLRILSKGIFKKDNEKVTLVTAQAGVRWDDLVEYTVRHGLIGLENLSAIPGTVGASPIQNIGAYGREVKDTIESVLAIDIRDASTHIFSNKECAFGYRESFFKKEEGQNFIITGVTFALYREAPLVLEYKDVKEYFLHHSEIKPSVQSVRNAVIEIRARKLPDPRRIGTAGSFFKNPVIDKVFFGSLQKKYPQIPSYFYNDSSVKISAAWLIDHVCDMRGVKEGNVGTHEKQAVALVAYDGATTKEVLSFAEKISKCVLKKTGVQLFFEVRKIGM